MILLIIQGIVLGLTLSVLLGPSFFTLIQTSIHRGFNSATSLAFGIFLSDITLVAICILGLSQFIYQNSNKIYFAIIGGIILIIFGIFTFTRKFENVINGDNDPDKPGILTFIIKGYLLNIANPVLIFFWVGVVSSVIASAEPGKLTSHVITFFIPALFTIFLIDILKGFIANKIKCYLKPKILILINHTVGVLLVIFGIILILRVVVFKSF